MASVYTVDASVFLNAFNPYEAGHEESHRLLARLQEEAAPIVVPTLLLPGVAAAVALTANGWAQAANHRDRYWLYVVYHCDTVPQLYRVPDPFRRLLARATGAVRINARDVMAAAEFPPPALPRIGLQMRLPGGYEQFTWYGRGPHETYVDRKEGAQVGVYSGTVDEQYVPYIVPQENGNKTEVRWVALTNEEGVGLLAVGSPWLSVSAHHYTTGDLTKAAHTYELKRREDITLNLDYRQLGLGSASCGPGRLEKYQLKPVEVRYCVRLPSVLTKTDSPMALSKQVIE
ncbi:MAG: DUF3883 domain-containing protein [Anaerolineae bacterium]|nr:MAG: DUF3883 domain-containing protein [Anaerolineae bacterium]